MAQITSSNVEPLVQRLTQLEQRLRLLLLLRGFGALAIAAVASIGAALVLDLLFDLGPAFRTGLLALCALTTVWVGWQQLLRPFLSTLTPEELAAVVERAYPQLKERLVSTVELENPDVPEEYKGSPLMRELLARQTLKQASRVPFHRAVPAAPYGRRFLFGMCLLALLLAPSLLAPDSYKLLLSRLFLPWQNYESVGFFLFDVEPGDCVIPRGDDLAIQVTIRRRTRLGRFPDVVWLQSRSETGAIEKRRMSVGDRGSSSTVEEKDRVATPVPPRPEEGLHATDSDADAVRFCVTVPRVNRSFSYCVRAGREHSRWYRVRAVDRPAVQTAVLDVAPPGYTGLPARVIDGLLGDIPVFERSQLTFQLTFNKPVTSADITWVAPERLDEGPDDVSDQAQAEGQQDDDQPLADRFAHADGAATQPVTVSMRLSADGRTATLVTEATLGGPFVFRLRDRFGLENVDEPSRRLQLLRDEPPQLELPGQPPRREVGPSDKMSLPVVATDDIGIGALELYYSVNDGEKRSVPVEGDQIGRRTVQHAFVLDLADMGVKVGDQLTYRVRAADTRPVPGPQEVWSDPRTLVVAENAPPPGADQLTARQKELKKELEQIIADLEENRSGVQELQKQAVSALRSRKPFEQNEAIPERIQQQRELAERVERLAERFEQHPLYANLTPDVQKVAREDLPAVQQTMQQAADSSLKQKAEQLKRSVAGLAEAERRLRDVESQFEKLAELERDLLELNRLAQQTQDLAEDVLALERQRTEEARSETAERAEAPEQTEPPADQTQSPQELLKRQQELSDELKELLDRRPELLDAARQDMLDRLEQLSQRAMELAEPQDLLAEALKEQAGEQAEQARPLAQQQERAVRQAEQLAASLETRRGTTPVPALDPEALREALDALKSGDLQEAAQRQQEAAEELQQLAEELKKAAELPEDPQEATQQLAERQRRITDELKKLAENEPGESASDQEREAHQRALRQQAARQVGVQMALANLPVPVRNRGRQQEAVNRSAEAARAALRGDAKTAQQQAERATREMERLAQDIGTRQQRAQRASRELAQLRKQEAEIGQKLRAAEQPQQQAEKDGKSDQKADDQKKLSDEELAELAKKQEEIAKRLAELDAPGAEPEQQEAVRRAAATLNDLRRGRPERAEQARRQAEQAMVRMQRRLAGQPLPEEQVAELQRRQNEIRQAAREAEKDRGRLAEQARRQRELAQEIPRVDAPAAPDEQQAAREAAELAAQRLADAAAAPEQRDQALAQAEQALQRLAEALQPPSSRRQPSSQGRVAEQPPRRSPRELQRIAETARRLADRQANLRRQTERAARQQDSRRQRRETEAVAQQQRRLREAAEELPPDVAPLPRAEALNRLEQAEQALRRTEPEQAAQAQRQAEQALRDVQRHAQAAAQALARSQPQRPDQEGRPSPTERLAEQTEQLAQLQRELQQQLERSLPSQNEAERADDSAGQPQSASQAQQESSPHRPPAQRADQEQQASRNERGSPRESAAQSEPEPSAESTAGSEPATASSEDRAARPRLDEVLRRQSELTREQAQLALEVAARTGQQSEPTQRALESVRQGQQAAEQARAGRFQQAAEAARRAAQAARETGQALRSTPDAEPLIEQANQLYQRENEVAEDLSRLAESAEARRLAQGRLQQQLAEAAEALSDELAETAEGLQSEPLGMQRQAQQAEQARDAVQRGRQAMSDAAEELQEGDLGQAAEAARQAAEALRQAAQQVRPSDAQRASPSPIPPDVGAEVARAAQQLQQAGQQLGQAARSNQQAPSEQQASSQASNESASQRAGAESQPSEGQQASERAGQTGNGRSPNEADSSPSGRTPSELAQSAQSLQQAARSLNQAAQQLHLAPGQPAGQSQQASAPTAGSSSNSRAPQSQTTPGGTPSQTGDGSGARVAVDLQQLQIQLKKMTMRNWGELPGHLRTEILQAARKRPNGDYAKLIKLYFEEISKRKGNDNKISGPTN